LLQVVLATVRIGPVLILVLLVVALSLASPFFFTERNLQNVVAQSSTIALLALGQLLVILTRGIDISVGSTMALSTVVGALAFDRISGDGAVVILAMIATGAMVGLLNGGLLVVGRLPHAFIVTLATFQAVRGIALLVSDGQANTGVPPLVETLGVGLAGPVPASALVVVAIAGIGYVFTRRTVWGRWIYATGGNPEAAKRVGIPVKQVLLSVYVLCGITAGIAGIVTAGRTGGGFPNAGVLAELDSIAAVIVGGASFNGGRGGVGNVLVGALTIGAIRNGLNLLNVDPYAQFVVIGAVVLVAVQLDVLRGRLEERVRVLQAQGYGGLPGGRAEIS
jgi:ribose transport system permease protein